MATSSTAIRLSKSQTGYAFPRMLKNQHIWPVKIPWEHYILEDIASNLTAVSICPIQIVAACIL